MRVSINRFKGLFAFLAVLFMMPLGHALMILMEHLLGHDALYPSAFMLGVMGLIMAYIGLFSKKESTATWLGFFGGILVWTGWVEFCFVFFARLLEVAPEMDGGQVVTKPEYLVMISSLGLLAATLPYFLFSRRTRCPFFRWMQKSLRLHVEPTANGPAQQYSLITFMETVYLLWTFYLVLLFLYHDSFVGDRHPLTYVAFVGFLIWSAVLFIRLMRYRKMGPAIRYAIPCVIIFWNSVEILGRWGFFKEVWVDPLNHAVEMVLIVAAAITAGLLAHRVGDKTPILAE